MPMVCTPENALQCFTESQLDVLVLGNSWIDRVSMPKAPCPKTVPRERAWLKDLAFQLTRPIHDTGGSYIISPMGDKLRVLSGVELAPRGAPPNHAQIRLAVAAAGETVRLGAPIDNEPWLGSRPSTPDGLPVIGPAPRHRGLFFAFGHGHIGLSTGPITGRVVADLLLGRAPAVPVEPFSAERFL